MQYSTPFRVIKTQPREILPSDNMKFSFLPRLLRLPPLLCLRFLLLVFLLFVFVYFLFLSFSYSLSSLSSGFVLLVFIFLSLSVLHVTIIDILVDLLLLHLLSFFFSFIHIIPSLLLQSFFLSSAFSFIKRQRNIKYAEEKYCKRPPLSKSQSLLITVTTFALRFLSLYALPLSRFLFLIMRFFFLFFFAFGYLLLYVAD